MKTEAVGKKGVPTAHGRVPFGSRNNEKETKTDKNRMKTMKTEADGKKTSPIADGRATYRCRCLPIVFPVNLIVTRLDYSQGCLELKKEEQSGFFSTTTFFIRLNIRDTRVLEPSSVPEKFDTRGFGKHKTNTDDKVETRWASMLEQRMENMVIVPQHTHYQSALSEENMQGSICILASIVWN
ncbi:hypothetical protein M9H77_06851 [Catharanthus roseus]|uniref:Uncharacterized protein n=1 Tax=Catharanthus roseus TaxID=4058 RepID=A0ACC0BTA0_CATRO|nr:hypothetical protein M9H77_06851 [Catharanthus roseus]